MGDLLPWQERVSYFTTLRGPHWEEWCGSSARDRPPRRLAHIRIGRHDPADARVDSQRAAMVRRVVGDAIHDGHAGRAAHDRPVAIGAISSASVLEDSVALAAATAFLNHARAAASDV